MANIARRAYDRSLKTDTSWWDMRGGRVVQVFNWVIRNSIWGFVGIIVAIIIAIITVDFG